MNYELHSGCFNSTMVRLKFPSLPTPSTLFEFQFHYGSIKIQILLP